MQEDGASNPYYSSRVPPGHGRQDDNIKVNEAFEYFHVAPRFLTPDECRRVVDLGRDGPRYPYFSQYAEDGEAGSIDVQNESHDAREILYAKDTEWLYERVWKLATEANRDVFRFRITELSTALILRTYNPGSSVKWHFDNVRGGEKIGLVVQLTDGNDYEGGELVSAIGVGDGFHGAPRDQGTALLFPTFICHSVLPLKSGIRQTLVGWVMGDTFV